MHWRPKLRSIAMSTVLIGGASGCLKVNPEYEFELAAKSGETTGSTQGKTGPLGTMLESSSDPTIASTPTPSVESMGDTTLPSLTGQGGEPGNSAGTFTNASAATADSDSTQDTTSTETPGDATRRIVVDASQVSYSVDLGYSIQLAFDHRAMVQAGASPYGSDLAVVFSSNGVSTPIHRVLDPSSSWNQSATKIWFRLQAPLAVGLVDSSSYVLELNASPERVLLDPNQVFEFHNEFEHLPVDANDWESGSREFGIGTFDRSQQNGYMQLRSAAVAILGFSHRASLVSAQSFNVAGLMVEGSMRVPGSQTRACNRSRPVMIETLDGEVRAGFGVQEDELWSLGTPSSFGGEVWSRVSGSPRISRNWRRYSFSWEGNRAVARFDGATLFETTVSGEVTEPSGQSLRVAVGVASSGPLCSLPSDRTELDLDWMLLRQYMPQEPAARLSRD